MLIEYRNVNRRFKLGNLHTLTKQNIKRHLSVFSSILEQKRKTGDDITQDDFSILSSGSTQFDYFHHEKNKYIN